MLPLARATCARGSRRGDTLQYKEAGDVTRALGSHSTHSSVYGTFI